MYNEDITLLCSRFFELERLNEDLVEKSFYLMFDMLPEIEEMDSVIPKFDNSADVRVDK